MPNRRFEVFEYRNLINRMRLGDSDRELSRIGLASRVTAAKVRAAARDRGWLDTASPMPTDEAIFVALGDKQPKSQIPLLEPFSEILSQWSEQGVTMKAMYQKLVRDYQFDGGYDCLRRFFRSRRRKSKESATVILDFKPGEAAQVDFGAGPKMTDATTGCAHKTWFFVMTLAYSRHQYLEFVTNQDVETWVGCHRRAFEFFGGVPGRLIIDNPKCAITKACFHDPEVQRSYMECAEGYGFLISPCPVADPQKKGIVESGVKYVKNNFLPLRKFRDMADLNRQAQEWIFSEAGNRKHGTTHELPLKRYAEVEKSLLKPLPDEPPTMCTWATAKVHGDCHVTFQNNRYSVPYEHVHKPVLIRTTENTVEIYIENKVVAMHQRLRSTGERSTVNDHYPPKYQAFLMHDIQYCLKSAEAIGECCFTLISELFATKGLDRLRAAQGILQLGKKFGAVRVENACSRALRHKAVTYRTVKDILTNGMDSAPEQITYIDDVYRGGARYLNDAACAAAAQ